MSYVLAIEWEQSPAASFDTWKCKPSFSTRLDALSTSSRNIAGLCSSRVY